MFWSIVTQPAHSGTLKCVFVSARKSPAKNKFSEIPAEIAAILVDDLDHAYDHALDHAYCNCSRNAAISL